MTHEKYFFHSPTTDKINIEKIRPPTHKKSIAARPPHLVISGTALNKI